MEAKPERQVINRHKLKFPNARSNRHYTKEQRLQLLRRRIIHKESIPHIIRDMQRTGRVKWTKSASCKIVRDFVRNGCHVFIHKIEMIGNEEEVQRECEEIAKYVDSPKIDFSQSQPEKKEKRKKIRKNKPKTDQVKQEVKIEEEEAIAKRTRRNFRPSPPVLPHPDDPVVKQEEMSVMGPQPEFFMPQSMKEVIKEQAVEPVVPFEMHFGVPLAPQVPTKQDLPIYNPEFYPLFYFNQFIPMFCPVEGATFDPQCSQRQGQTDQA